MNVEWELGKELLLALPRTEADLQLADHVPEVYTGISIGQASLRATLQAIGFFKHSRFCIYHRKISHSTMDCYVLWDIFDKKIRSGELRLQGNVDANPFPGHKGKAVANMISSAWSPLKKRFNEEPQANIIGLSEPIEERLKKNKPGVFIFILSMLHQIRQG